MRTYADFKFIENKSLTFIIQSKYWDTYILIKHSCEVLVLGMELIVSTNISESSDQQNKDIEVTTFSTPQKR